MFRAKIDATEITDVNTAVADLRMECKQAGLAPIIADSVVARTQEVLTEFVEKGRTLAASGSQMKVARDISGEGYSVKLVFQTAATRQSLFARLRDALRAR